MEPVAPGTEEDMHQAPLVSKKVKKPTFVTYILELPPTFLLSTKNLAFQVPRSTEQTRLLSIKAFLPDGIYGNVFELSYNNGSEHWYCKMCRCPIMGRVFYHEVGKRHSTNMSAAGAKSMRAGESDECPDKDLEVANIKVAPGEPVPPGFEGEITKVAQIQERLDSFRSGSLLGLEYLLEIQDYDQEKEPSYLCLLCGKKGDPRTVVAHLVSYNHLQGYLQRHFPKTYFALAPYVTRQYKKNWQDTMNKIAEAIETKYGRLLPHPVDPETFETKKDELHQMVQFGPHFSEKNGVTFENLIDKDEITRITEDEVDIKCEAPPIIEPARKRSPSPPVVSKPKKPKPSVVVERRRSLSSVSSISSSELSDFNDVKDTKEKRVSQPRQPELRRRSRSRSPIRNYRTRYDRNSPPPAARRDRREAKMPWNRPDYVRPRSITRSGEYKPKPRDDKHLEFKKLSAAIENDMAKALKQHKVNPEKHPQYNEEWKIFWNKRYKELQGEGKDASKYDFKPEWIVYWNVKIVDIHNAEVKTKIEALRKRLGVVEPAPVSFKIAGRKKGPYDKPAPMASQPDNDHDVIIIDDKDDDSRSSRRSHSPWESESVSRSKMSTDRRPSLDSVSSNEPEEVPLKSRPKGRQRDRHARRSKERSWERSSNRDRRDYRSKDRDYRSREKSWDPDIIYCRESRIDLGMYKPPSVMRDVTRKPVDYDNRSRSPEVEDSGDVNVVAVLRLLTALEDKLGSLGPKIIDMLSMALAMEKKEANSSETLLDNEMNCVLFETVKEKLKGALHAGLVDYNQEKAFKGAVTKIAGLIHLAGTRKAESEAGRPKVDPVKVPGVGTVDKSAIAKQIATALMLQGKTDVSQEELEQLINAVVGMAEASKNSNKPITTASFLESWSKQPPKEEEKPKVEEEILVAPDPPPTITPPVEIEPPSNIDTMDGLSDSDLQTLLQNFKDLSTEEQHGLITYLKKLEAKEPDRVEKLRKFVNLGPDDSNKDDSGRISPFSQKLNTAEQNPTKDTKFGGFDEDVKFQRKEKLTERQKEPPAERVKFDSDDEEYSYEDVFKAANKNVEQNKLVKERKIIEDSIKRVIKPDKDVLTDAKALIANIMGSIAAKSSPRVDSQQVQPSFAGPDVQPGPSLRQDQPNKMTQGLPNPAQSLPNPAQGLPNQAQGLPNSAQGLPNPAQGLLNPAQNSSNVMQNSPNLTQNLPGVRLPGRNPNRLPFQQPGHNGPPRAPFMNQPIQYPMKNPNNPYGGNFQPGYGNNYNFSNQFNQNSRFNPGRGQFPNKNNYNNRGNFNNRW